MTVDVDTLSMDDIRKLAEEEARSASTKTPLQIAAEQTALDDTPLVDPEEVKTPKTFYSEETVDLGDGGGVQVFKGKGDSILSAQKDLIGKLADAQRNATKKIRDLVKSKPSEKTYSKDDEALYSAELMATPTTAFKKLFKEVTGVDVEEFKTVTAREKAFQEANSKKSIADQFTLAHPEYVDNDRNGKRINAWLTLHNDFSLDGFKKAYQDLSASGLLEVKGEEASDEQKTADEEAQRIAAASAAASSQRTRKASGLSTQRKSVTPPPAALSEDDMYSLPLEEIRKRANQQLAAH